MVDFYGKCTVDGSEIRQTHQLRERVVYPVIYRVLLYIPGGDRRISEPSKGRL